jgi:hypothetical protein
LVDCDLVVADKNVEKIDTTQLHTFLAGTAAESVAVFEFLFIIKQYINQPTIIDKN